MTDFLPSARRIGNWTRFGTSVSPKWKWKTSVRGSRRAKAAHWRACRSGSGLVAGVSSDQSASGCSLYRSNTTSRASTPRRRRAWAFVQGPPAVLTGQSVTRSGRSATRVRARVDDRAVEVDLVEVAQARPPRLDPRPQRRELLVRDLAERALDAEVREVEVVLVDDRRDARVDLDHVLAHELDVEEPLDRELLDELVRRLHQLLVLERHEVHRKPRPHRLARLRVAEHHALTVGDPVDRALTAGGELHHEQVGTALVREQLDRLLEPHRHRPGALVEQLVRAVDGRVEDAEAAGAGGEDGLETDRSVGVAELLGGRRDLGGAVDAAEMGPLDAEALQQGIALRLVVRAVNRVR